MGGSDVRIPIVVPDFARTAAKPITLFSWTKKMGQRVRDGDRIAELVCDKADFELSAPATGVLVDVSTAYNVELAVGQVIGWIDPSIEPWIWDPPPEHPTAIGRCVYCTALLFPGDIRCRNCAALL
jgi:hypothetical protein